MSSREKLLKIGLPFLVLLIGAAIAVAMIKNRRAPEKTARVDRGALVKFIVAEKSSRQVTINSTGTVQPRREVTIAPQVSGQVIFVSPDFVTGGFFSKDEVMFEIEKIDYELALEQARAALAKREFELSSVESRARIARREWQRLKNDQEPPANSLALYEPQLKDARANLASARAALRQAELNLARTRLTAPFNCVIRSENIDVGQYVRSGNNVAVIAGTDTAEVIVPVELDDLHWLFVPGAGGSGKSSPATVSLEIGTRTYSWPGKLDRRLGEVDPQGRMVRLAVEIDDPYLLKKTADPGQPVLSIGSFVAVAFQGKEMREVFALPRPALHQDNTVWVMTPADLLKIKKVEIARLEREEVFVSAGLEPGARIILTNLTGAADGMKLRAAERGAE
ncbi:MAG: efflux RND transporter periplasmic adaptor subunit [Desulfobulbales bacterium]|nr:efflux RND transporter periplasmic adaptor subunit [Desulfobulbales bacterium]